MAELQLLTADHTPAVLAFEQANRAWFARSISDRGDAWFEEFADRHRDMLDDQAAGRAALYLLVEPDGSVLGRFNLHRLESGTAELGYRLAEAAAGRGLATSTVAELCGLAVTRHGLRTIRAGVAADNVASQRVLNKNGFRAVGSSEVGGRPGTWFQRDL